MGTCVYILVVIVVRGWDGEVLPNTCSCFVVFTGNFYSCIQFGFDPSYTTDSIQKIKGSQPSVKYRVVLKCFTDSTCYAVHVQSSYTRV